MELLPTVGAVVPKNFPGMIDAAYIVNAGWTQRSLWKVVQKVVPKSAMEKIRFLDGPSDVEEFFDLDRLPKGSYPLKSGITAKISFTHSLRGADYVYF